VPPSWSPQRPLNGERQEVAGRNRRLLIFKHEGFVRLGVFWGDEVLPPAQMPACKQRSPPRRVLHAVMAGTNRASPAREVEVELMEVYRETMAPWIIARLTSGKCEGAEFVFGLIESAIREEATEILLIPVQELEMVRMDFGRPHCYYRQPDITRAQFAYLALYLVLNGNVAAKKARTENYSADQTEGSTICNFGRMRLPDNEPAVGSAPDVRYTSRYGSPSPVARRRGV
jgi:hypothetical protein